MTKAQWKIEQQGDPEIGPVMQLVLANKHLQYKFQKEDNPGSKIILCFRDNLKLVDGLLYRKWVYKNEIMYLQFVLPCEFCKWMVISCHDQFGHLGMDNTLVLLQEWFFWSKMNDDVRHHIHNCERCLHFKQKPERDEMHSIKSSYPMEIVHMDFLVIGSKKDPDKEINVLVVTDHFIRYAQAFVTTPQAAHTVAITLYEKYLVHYGWLEKLHSDQAGNFESKLIAEFTKLHKYRR